MKSCGVLYIAFGESARREVLNSCHSLREHSSKQISVVVVGDAPIEGMEYIRWKGREDIYNKNGRLLCGEIKPFLCSITPFDQTLYLDADTTILQDIRPGFEFLQDNDICIANHHDGITLASVPATPEREATIKLLGNMGTPLINAGVIFFRKNRVVKRLFAEWYLQWKIARVPNSKRDWDEQLALHRAIYNCPARIFYMEEKWNQKFREHDTIIWHEMGSGKARL